MNRFVDAEQRAKAKNVARNGASRGKPATSGPMTRFVRPFAATDRALVILIENGGIDVGLGELVDRLVAATPLSTLVSAEIRQSFVTFLNEQIRSATDRLFESAELALNRYSAARPELFGEVTILRDGSASYEDLKSKLIVLSRAQKIVDLFVLTHGSRDFISVAGGIDGARIRAMKVENGRPLSLRSVYMMNCVGASLNQAWLDAGAKTASGSIGNNYLPEPTTYFFWQNWQEGQNFESAVLSAYRRTVSLLNSAVRSFVRALPIPGSGLLADQLNVEALDFVQASAPVVQGQRTVTVQSDDLVFTQSIASSLASTVLPLHQLQAISVPRALSLSRPAPTSRARSLSPLGAAASIARPMAVYSYAQNPVITVEAASLGLTAIGLVQSQANASQGAFTLTYQQAQRLLSSEARNRMPGAQRPKSSYNRRIFRLTTARPGIAYADIFVRWEGNDYGEISTPLIQRDLPSSSEFTQSSASINITKLDRIPLPNSDPRAWPIVYAYEGTYNPLGNGYFEFSGEIELDAFGGLKFARPIVVSRSLIEAPLQPAEAYVQRGEDVIVAPPPIPDDQMAFLRSALP